MPISGKFDVKPTYMAHCSLSRIHLKLFLHPSCPIPLLCDLHPLYPDLWPSPLFIPPSHLASGLHRLTEPLCTHYCLLLFASLPGRMTSGKPSLRVSARALLNTAWFSRLICSSSPLSSCREMMRPGSRGWLGVGGHMRVCKWGERANEEVWGCWEESGI